MFVLKNPNAKTSTAIILQYYCKDGRLKYYTNQSIDPEEWTGKVDTCLNKGVRAQLRRLIQVIQQYERECQELRSPILKEELSFRLDRVAQKRRQTGQFFDKLTEIVDKMEVGKILTPGEKMYSAGSIKTYRFTVGLLQEFDPKLTTYSYTAQDRARFIAWGHKKDYSTNYIGSQIKNWRRLLILSGVPQSELAAFSAMREPAMDVYLTDAEIEDLVALKIGHALSLIRDWFIIDCFTGLRISDIQLLKDKNLSEEYITIANKKTNTKVVIPIHRHVRNILKKYGGLPPAVSSHDMNIHIKDIAKKAGITKDVLHVITKGGVRKDTWFKKYEMITNHTARRSLITNLKKAGVPDSVIMKLTGIKSLVTLQAYDKITPDEAAEVAKGLSYFK